MGVDLQSLFLAHERDVGAYLKRRVGDAADAADLSQETFLRLARPPDGKVLDDPRGILFTIAANLARDHLRGLLRRRRSDAGPVEANFICPCADPEEDLDARQRTALLQEAIAALPDKTRAVLLLYNRGDHSYRDIAGRLGLSPRTVEYHLRQALERCRDYVRQKQASDGSAG